MSILKRLAAALAVSFAAAGAQAQTCGTRVGSDANGVQTTVNIPCASSPSPSSPPSSSSSSSSSSSGSTSSASGGAGGNGGAGGSSISNATGGSIAPGAVQNQVAGGNSTIQSGAVQATNNASGGAGGSVGNVAGGSSTIQSGAVQATNNASGGAATIQSGAVQNQVAGGAATVQTGAVQNQVAGGAATIQSGAVQNQVAGGASTIQSGAVQTTNSNAGGAATVQSGAVQSSNNSAGGNVGNVEGGSTGPVNATNAGNTVTINNPVAKQATHMNVAAAPGNISGCVAQKGFSMSISAVGAGAVGTSFTTGANMIEGCTQADMDKSIVYMGVSSNDPAKIVAAFVVAKQLGALDHLKTPEGQADMALFGRRAPAPAPVVTQQPHQPTTVVVSNHHYNAQQKTEAPSQTQQFVCNIFNPKTGNVERGEVVTIKGQAVCKAPGDAAPTVK